MTAKFVAVLAQDKPLSSELRASTRPAHIKWAKEASLRFGGPLVRDGLPVGSLMLLSGRLDDVHIALMADPYSKAGLFERVEVHEWVCEQRTQSVGSTLYCIWSVGRVGQNDLRVRTEELHRKWWHSSGRIGMTGSLVDKSSDEVVGTLIVCEGKSLKEVTEWASTDPYNLSGLYQSVFCAELRKVMDNVFL